MEAIGYARWSSLEQGRGSSLARQTEAIERFCSRQGWTLLEQVRDEGLSAYSGANIRTGNLADIIRRVEAGALPRNLTVVVEQLDRISRLPPSQVIQWIQQVAGLGLSIATANDGQIIDAKMIDANPMTFVGLVFTAFRAFQESKHKSERLSESWRIKRLKIANGDARPLTSVCPAWVRLDKATSTFALIPERAAIVDEIFRRTLFGDGKRLIATDLNQRGIEPWGSGKSKAEGWHPSYIQKILCNPAVIGEFQPHTKARDQARRVPVGDPVQGYFPPAISESLWSQVRALRPRPRGNDGQRGEVNNLFSGLCRCGVCGGPMAFQLKAHDGLRMRKGRPARQRRMSYLLCDRHARKLGCKHTDYYRYERFEDGILDALLSAALKDSFFADHGQSARLSDEHYKAIRQLEVKGQRVERLLDLYMETGDPDLKERWLLEKAELTSQEAIVTALQNSLDIAKGQVPISQHAQRVQKVRQQLSANDIAVRTPARKLVASSLKQMVETIEFNGGIHLYFRGVDHVVRFDLDGQVIDETHVLGSPARRLSTGVH